VIQQSGSGISQSQVTRYRDGQTVVTRDGRSTDITIQRGQGSSSPAPRDVSGSAPVERFDRPSKQERFRSGFPIGPEESDDYDERSAFAQDTFRERMLERMREYP
jgi:hypothetical protein